MSLFDGLVRTYFICLFVVCAVLFVIGGVASACQFMGSDFGFMFVTGAVLSGYGSYAYLVKRKVL